MKTHCNAILALFARGWLAAALLFVAADCQSQPVNLSYLDGKDPVAPDAVTTFGPDLFGDRVNVFNGALGFEQTDLSLPGNSALPVALARHHSPGQAWFVRGQFDDWDLQAPRIGGSFANTAGWVTSFYGVNRCSGFSLPPAAAAASAMSSPRPPMVSGRGSTSPLTQGGPSRALPDAVVGFDPVEYWRRTSLDIPGQGSQEVLLRSPAYTSAPSDGASYPLVTHNNWQIGCLPSVQNAAGEGFVAVSPEGIRYRFDWMATRMQTDLKKSGATLGRTDYFLMATLATDRFGNWVRYTYDSGTRCC